MKILGWEIKSTKSKTPKPVGTSAIGAPGSAGYIREPYMGAWQQNKSLTTRDGLLASSAVFACVDLISSDVSKLRIKYVKLQDNVWQEASAPRFTSVLRKPNAYQTRAQFMKAWVASKLTHGNAYILLSRNSLGVVIAMDVLNPKYVVPLVALDGSVYYQVTMSPLQVTPMETAVIPARDMIHDRGVTAWHPLVGMTPIAACAAAVCLAEGITTNSAAFFANGAKPGAFLSATGAISDETAKRLKATIDANYPGTGAGKTLVGGDGLTYQPMTMTGTDAQLIEQLNWTAADVARCFHVPGHKIGLETGSKTAANAAIYDAMYYSDCLQAHLEAVELLLDDALAVADTAGFEFDLSGLIRMDEAALVAANTQAVGAGIMSPNEARARQGLPPVPGGDTPYLQAQWIPLSMLKERAAQPATTTPAGEKIGGNATTTDSDPPPMQDNTQADDSAESGDAND